MNRRIGNMSWPAPGEYMDDLEWRLRYGWVSREGILGAAAIIAAYRQLILEKKDKRQALIKELRKGPDRPEKPCPNCQGAESKEKINRMWNKEGTEILCFECGRPESEWTYAKDRWKAEWQVAEPGGIGCGGTGGPL